MFTPPKWLPSIGSIAAFFSRRELVFTVFTTWIAYINTSEVVNTSRDLEKIFASRVHKL